MESKPSVFWPAFRDLGLMSTMYLINNAVFHLNAIIIENYVSHKHLCKINYNLARFYLFIIGIYSNLK